MSTTDTQTASSKRPRKRWWWAVVCLALMLIFFLLSVLWIVNTSAGLRTSVLLAERFMGGALIIEGVEGAMTGPFKASKLHFESANLRIDANDISVDWQSRSTFSRHLQIDSLIVGNITVATKPSTTSAKMPTDLTLPFSLDIRMLNIDRLRMVAWEAAEGLAPVTLAEINDIHARAVSDGRFHQLSDVALTTVFGRAAAGAVLDGAPPFNLAAAVKLNGSRDDKNYQISADATGTLAAIIVKADATGWNLNGDAAINVTPFAPVPIQHAVINMGEINPAAFSAAAPQAALTIRANLTSPIDTKKSTAIAVDDWNLVGPIEITNRSPAALDLGGIPVMSLRADAEWKNASLDLRNLSLISDAKSGSSLTGTASLRRRVIGAQLSVKNVDPRTWISTLKTTRLNGEIALTASETAQSIEAKLQEPDNKIAPWRAELLAAHQGDEVEIKALKLLAGNAALTARGKLSLSKDRPFSFTGGLADFDTSRFADVPRAKLNADFTASGALKPELSADIKFDLRNSVIVAKDGTHAITGRGDIQFSPSRIARAEVMLDMAGNRLDTSGAWGRAGDKLKFALLAPRLDMLGLNLSGKLDASGELTGTLSTPSGEINASATSLQLTPTSASKSGTKIAQLKLNAKLSDGVNGLLEGTLKIIGIKSDAPADKTAATTTLVEQIDANLTGTRAAHSLRVMAKISDTEAVDVGLNGALAAGLKWQGKLDRLTINSRLVNLALANAAPLAMSRDAFKLGLTELRSSEANPTAKARIRLIDSEWTPLGWQTRCDMSGLQLNTLRNVGNIGDSPRNSSRMSAAKLTLGAEWDVRASDHLDGSARLFRESGDVLLPGDTPIAPGLTDLEIKLNAVQDKVSGTVLAKGEKFGVLNGAGSFEVQRTSNAGSANYLWEIARLKPITLDANADMASLSWLGPLIDPALQLTGKLRADMKVSGTAASPRAVGSLRGTTLTAAWPDEGFKLTDGEVAIDFSDTRAALSQFSFRADPNVRPREGRIDFAELKSTPGTLTGSGELALADGKGAFKFKADKLALIQRANRWLMLSGDATVNTAWDAVGVVGKLRADAGYFELASAAPPRLSDDVLVRRRGGEVASDKSVRFSVDIDANLGNQLYFNGRGLSTRLAGEVRLRAEPKSPLRVLGSVSAASGTFDAYGQYLTIERGILNFQGPIETAGLNVLALRKGLAVEAGVEITGTVAEPRVRLVSEPNVPDTEKLSWIVVGRGQDQAGSSDSALLLSAATAILGGSSDSLPRQIAQGLGFDQLTVSSGSLGGNQSSLPTTTAGGSTSASTGGATGGNTGSNVSSQIVTLGKRLSANAYVSYEQSLAGASSVVKLTYNLSRRISIIGRAGTDNSIDLSYTFSFN